MYDCISMARGELPLSRKDKTFMVDPSIPSSKHLNSRTNLLPDLLALSLKPKFLAAPVTPTWSSSQTNLADLVKVILPVDPDQSCIHSAMQSALQAQKTFAPKKAHNLDELSRKEASKLIEEGKTDRGKKEVSVVSRLIAKRSLNGDIVEFVLRVGELDLVLDLDMIDGRCGGKEGRELFFNRNRHQRKNVGSGATREAKLHDRHGLKTQGARIVSISARCENVAVRNFQNTSAECERRQEFEKTKKEGETYKPDRRTPSWNKYAYLPHSPDPISSDNRMRFILTIL